MLNDRGFTLVEILFVVSIILILVAITLPYSKPVQFHYDELIIERFLYDAHLMALQTKMKVNVILKDDSMTYSTDELSRTEFLREATFLGTYQFHYNASGNISKAGTYDFLVNGDEKSIVTQLGSGAFYIE